MTCESERVPGSKGVGQRCCDDNDDCVATNRQQKQTSGLAPTTVSAVRVPFVAASKVVLNGHHVLMEGGGWGEKEGRLICTINVYIYKNF